MEDYSRQRHLEAGYEFVNTPHISKAELFDISGHLGFYADLMHPPMHVDEERHPDGSLKRQGQDYYLKPMNCPMHCLIFRSRGGRTASCRCDCSSSAAFTGTRCQGPARAHPGPRHDPGRLHLLHRRPDAR